MLDDTEQLVSGDQSKCGGSNKNHQAHLAGLKRLSARASAGPVTPPGTRRVFFSFSAYARSVIDKLRKSKVPIADGLSDEEFERIEATYGFTFPPDLKGILQAGLPVGAGFPNWRTGNPEHLRMLINLPVVGLLHEVANSNFWWKAWGPRPVDTKQAVRSARSALRRSSILVPMYGHCYIPSSPNLAGNPLFFVYQKNVVYCGYDVAEFLDREAFLSHKFEFGDLMYDMGSFRNEKSIESVSKELTYQADADSFRRASSSSSGTDASEASGSGSSNGEGESWGRSLDVLAQSSGFLVSPHKGKLQSGSFGRLNSRSSNRQLNFSRSFDGRSHEPDSLPAFEGHEGDIMKYSCIVEKPLPLKTLMKVSLVPGDARSPRRIEFWSDLAEKVQKKIAPQGEAFSSQKMDVARPRSSPLEKHVEENYLEDKTSTYKSSMWLNGYLGELSLILRQGGWREDDINDMIDTQSPSQRWNQQLDAEGVLVSLAREVELLSTSLKKAGWTVPDASETMKVGLSALF